MDLIEKVARAARDATATVYNTAKEQSEFASIKLKMISLEKELDEYYRKIGKRYVEYVRNSELEETFDAELLMEKVDPIADRYDRLKSLMEEKKAYVREEYNEKDRKKAKHEYDKAKVHLKSALDNGIITQEEYEEKLESAKKKVDYFDEIRKIKMQRTLGIITKAEYEEKIQKVLKK